MKYRLPVAACLLLLFFCFKTASNLTNKLGSTVKTRFNLPPGYTRIETVRSSFGAYLQNHGVKPDGSKVHYYNGRIKDHDVHEAILNVDVGKRDLQQCADAIMRLRAEYLFGLKQYNKIHFNFTSGLKRIIKSGLKVTE